MNKTFYKIAIKDIQTLQSTVQSKNQDVGVRVEISIILFSLNSKNTKWSSQETPFPFNTEKLGICLVTEIGKSPPLKSSKCEQQN